jgi:hypothetical protein
LGEQSAEAATSRGRQQLLDAIHSGQAFGAVLGDLGLTSNQVWGLTKTDEKWSEQLEAALTATRRDDLQRHHIVGTEGMPLAASHVQARLVDPAAWQAVLDTARAIERVPELLGLSPHLIATARRSPNRQSR